MTDEDPTVHSYDEGVPYRPSPTSTPVDVEEPHVPWYKDEKLRLWGEHGPSSAATMRALIIAVTIALIVMGWVSYRAYSYGTKAHNATDILNTTINENHKTRIANDKIVKQKLRQLDKAIAENKSGTRDLACSVVIFVRNQPDFQPNPFVKFLAGRYHCKDYLPLQTVFPGGDNGSGGSGRGPPVSSGPSSPGSSTSATSTVPIRPTRTVTSTAPAPPRKTVTTTHTQPPPPSSTHLACVLKICIG